MTVTELKNKSHLPELKQSTSVSCWATCGAALSTYFWNESYKVPKKTEKDVAKALNTPLDKLASIEDVLVCIGCATDPKKITVDNANLPTNAEIAKELSAGLPLVLGIHATKSLKNPAKDQLTDGHYMIIVGVDDTKDLIEVMDPAGGNFVWTWRTDYSQNGYNKAKFCKTFYPNTPPK